MSKEANKSYQVGGLLFVGASIIGTAIGLAIDNVAVGSMVGAGAGFVLLGLAKVFIKD